MAYRASAKRTTVKKKDEESQKPEAPVVPASDLSVEDIVGGPPSHAEPEPRQEAERAKEASVETPPVGRKEPQAPSGQSDVSQPVPYEDRRQHRGGRGSYGGGGGYGGYRQRQFNGGYRRSRGEYHEQEAASAPYTQDINVPTETVKGILDIMPEGHGFLRPKFTPSDRDVYISQSQIRRFLLRNGDQVEGQARPPKDNERYYGLLKVEKVNEIPAEDIGLRPKFEDLVPVYPNTLVRLETGTMPLSTRIMDLLSPIGFGQRGLIVSPPKAGKTTILKEIAAGVSENYPEVHLMAALIGERPEEVTDLSRSIKGEVLASNFDESPAEQTRIAEVALDRAKRLVEMGKDVVILLDSITRLARAYNLVVNPSGRTLSGGFDPAALYPAKKFLGAARCVEPQPGSDKTTGGSLTVIGTALVDTGSRMDDLIYEEFKGTGNMELHLSRSLQERRVFPAIDISKSGTRHDELLLGEEKMKRITTLRHMLTLLSEEEQTAKMIEQLSKAKSNAEFMESLGKG